MKRRLVAILAFVLGPGAGHFLLGRGRRGAVLAGTLVAMIALAPWLPFASLAGVVMWLVILVDTFRVKPADPLPPWRAVLWRSLLCASALITIGVFARGSYLEAFKIPSAGMSPTLAIGDHVQVFKGASWFGPPARGDVIVFRYPCDTRFDYVKRVVGVAGDSVEVRCRNVFVNGEALPHEPADECSIYDEHPPSLGPAGEGRTIECQGFYETAGDRRYKVAYDPASAGHAVLDFPTSEPVTCDFGDHAAVVGELTERRTGAGACEAQQAMVVPEGHVFVMGDNRDASADSRRWGMVPLGHIVGPATVIWWGGNPAQGLFSRLGWVD